VTACEVPGMKADAVKSPTDCLKSRALSGGE
jgi:hypothetical protein